MKKIVRKTRKEDNSGLFVPAGLFLGIGFGFLVGQIVAGTMIGLGAGFLGLAIIKNKDKLNN